jgi:hypothetical protein
MRNMLLRAAIVLYVVLPVAPAEAGIIRVPEDYASVLAAVDAAVSGDSVLVGPGVWTDRETRLVIVDGTPLNITSCAFLKAGLTVIGVEGPANTTVDGGEETTTSVDTFIHVRPGNDPVRIEGFEITGGGDGIVVCNNTIEVADCWLAGNGDCAILAWSCEVVLRDCTIENNDLNRLQHDAIHCWMADLEMRNCRVAGNLGTGIDVYEAGSVIIDGCEIADHSGHRGASLGFVSNVQVTNSLFVRNSVGSSNLGGALSIVECGQGEIFFCVFAHDSATAGQAGALYVYSSRIRIENNTFYGIRGGHPAGAASAVLIGPEDGGFTGNIVASCSPGPALRKEGGPSHPDTGCNLLWDNPGGNYFGDWVPASTDIFADPQFCDAAAGDYTLHSTSPAAPENSPTCGLIGALGVDCGPISIEPTSWGQIKNLYR